MRWVSTALFLTSLLAVAPALAQPTASDEPASGGGDDADDLGDTGDLGDAADDGDDGDPGPSDTGYIGGTTTTPELDHCQPPIGASNDEILASASEHYDRGNTLYTQGDYQGAITEFVAAYCDAPHHEMLWNIAQSFERMVDYESAVAYLSRYILELPRDQVAEREKMSFRVQVLSNLPAQVRVATVPPGAAVTLTGATGVNARGVANEKKKIEVRKGIYEMRVELPGYDPVTETIEVEIGQPYSYYYRLEPKKGTIRITTDPSNARIFLDKRLVAIGSYVERLPIGIHTVTVEASGRAPKTASTEVSADQTANLRIDLDKKAKSGRRELLIASTVAGGVYGTSAFITLFEGQTLATGLGGLAGFGLGFAGGYFGVPRDITVGTSSYIIGSGIIAAGEGALVAALIGCDHNEVLSGSELVYKAQCPQESIAGIALIAGIGGTLAATLTADRFDPDAGDSAMVNSGALWGIIGGGLFAVAFKAEDDSRLWAPLALAGLTLGTTAGVLLARRAEVGRGHVALIDLSGLAGMIAGVALVDVIEPPGPRSERLPHFALIGMTAGLITGTYITRNMDDPKSAPLQKIQPEVGAAIDAAGIHTPTLGLSAVF